MAELNLLAATSAVPGVDLVLVTDRPQMNKPGDLVISGNSAQIGDPAFVAELKHWLRLSPNTALRTGDGLFSASSGNPALPDRAGPLRFDMAYTVKAETKNMPVRSPPPPGLPSLPGRMPIPRIGCRSGGRASALPCKRRPLG